MSKIELLHGSDHVIEKPDFQLGKINNDYGRGFYCTKELLMAMECACKQNTDGFVNKYSLEQGSLKILNLLVQKSTRVPSKYLQFSTYYSAKEIFLKETCTIHTTWV